VVKNRFIWSFFNWKISVQIPFLLFALFALVVCFSLANWQWQRAQLSDALFQKYQFQNTWPQSVLSESPEAYQKVAIAGQVKNHYFLDNKTQLGSSGWHVLAEVQTKEFLILVNLGWQPKQKKLVLQSPLPEYVEVQGLIREPQAGFMLQESNLDPNWPKLMQQVEIPLLNQHLGIDLFPFVLYADNQIGQLIPAPIEMENKYYMHVGYAIQWLLIGLASIISFIVFSRKEYKENE
jgi:cytochrome oxidase assembly protein ShyY1